jgi:hypothetical protein
MLIHFNSLVKSNCIGRTRYQIIYKNSSNLTSQNRRDMNKKPSINIFLLAALFLFTNNANAQSNNSAQHLLRHIVIITFKHTASPDSIQALDNLYKRLSKSPFVKDFETGVNVSTRDTGVLKHVYVTSFASKENMQHYSKMPEYASLFKISLPIAEEVSVVDYWIDK